MTACLATLQVWSPAHGLHGIVGMRAIRARVSKAGRLSIPVELRKAIGLGQGGVVVVDLDGTTIRVRTVDGVVADAQAIVRDFFRDRPKVSVDEFIAARHRGTEAE